MTPYLLQKRPTITREMLEGEQDLEGVDGPGEPVRGAVARRLAGTNVIPLDFRGAPRFLRIESLSRVFPLSRVESNASSTSATVLQEDEESIATTDSATVEMSNISSEKSKAYLEMEPSTADTPSVNNAMLSALRLRHLIRNHSPREEHTPTSEPNAEYVSMEDGTLCGSSQNSPPLHEYDNTKFVLMQDTANKLESIMSSSTERNSQKSTISQF